MISKISMVGKYFEGIMWFNRLSKGRRWGAFTRDNGIQILTFPSYTHFQFPKKLRGLLLVHTLLSSKATHKTIRWDQHTLTMFLIGCPVLCSPVDACLPSMLIPYPGLCTLTSCHHSWDLEWWLSWFLMKSLPWGRSIGKPGSASFTIFAGL